MSDKNNLCVEMYTILGLIYVDFQDKFRSYHNCVIRTAVSEAHGKTNMFGDTLSLSVNFAKMSYT